MRKSIVLFLVLIYSLGCSSDDKPDNCATVSCLSSVLSLQFLSSETGEDLFGNGTFDKEMVQVTNELPEGTLQGGFTLSGDNMEEYFLGEIVENTGPRKYRFVLPNQFDFTISYDVRFENVNDCCPLVVRKNVTFQEGVTVEQVIPDKRYVLLF